MPGRKVLFSVGIDNYQSDVWKNLSNPVLDCNTISSILKERYTFEELEDPLFNERATKQNIYNALNTLKQSIEPEDSLIIFYAGHGNMNPHTRRGYWIPYESTTDVSTWIENSVIKDFVQDINAKHIWLVADSCFSGAFLTTTRDISLERSYTTLEQQKSRWMLASGGEEKVSDGTPQNNSPFCKFLFRVLSTNSNKHLSIVEVMLYVQTLTKNNSHQTPNWAYIENIGHANGEMVLTLTEKFVKTAITITRGVPNSPELRLEIAQYQQRENKLSAGKEILLVKSIIEGADLMILENFRFDEHGEKKIKFENNHALIGPERLTLLNRFATWTGINRFLDSKEKEFEASKIIAINAHEDIESVEGDPFALAHSAYLQELLDFNKTPMTCLHCGEKISTNDSLLVEIDEVGLKNNVGNVHKECLRNADRILGQSGYLDLRESRLKNFNYNIWLELLERGQGQLKAIANKLDRNKIAILSWNPEHNRNEGRYCIKINYENGISSFMRLGKEIHRFGKNEIDTEVADFNGQIATKEFQGNPLGMVVESKLFGSYNTLMSQKKISESIVKVIGFEKAIYSSQLEDASHDVVENDYTPIGLVKIEGEDELFTIGQVIPLLTKPEEFDSIVDNWSRASGNTQSFTIKIIKSDFELDSYLQSFFEQGLQPVINPIFNVEKKTLESGLIVKSFQTIISEGKQRKSEVRTWRKDDKVRVVFPNVETDKYATGILVTDEFLDENNERCAVFQPIEKGQPLEGMQFKLPVKLLQRWKNQ